MQHSPWALQRITLKVDVGVAFRLLADDLVPSVLALRRKQVRIEREHFARGNGPSSLCNALGLLSLLKITHPSLSPYRRMELQRNEYTRFAWAGGTFFTVVLLCQFLVLAGNRFWFYILMYLEYNAVVVLC
jgi:hypothetical protein